MTIDLATGRSAAGIIRLLDLQPHPEGGFFVKPFAIRRKIRRAGPSRH